MIALFLRGLAYEKGLSRCDCHHRLETLPRGTLFIEQGMQVKMLRAIKAALLAVMTVFGFGFSLTTISPTQVYPISPVDHP